MGVGRGFGKLLLFGEHAAVYGYPAVGIRLEDYLEVELQADAHSRGWDLPSLPEGEHHLVREAIRALPDPPASGRLVLRGALPTSVGLGSSAAFCTGLLRAHLGDRTPEPDRLWAMAHELERIFHGTPSGIDTGLSVYAGLSIVYPDPPRLPRREPLSLPSATILAGALPRTGTTAKLVAGIRELRERDANRVDGILQRLGELSATVAVPTLCPGVAELGAAAREAQRLLAELGLCTPELDVVLDLLEAHGASGAKLSGAGGGGAFFGFFADKEQATVASHAVRRHCSDLGIRISYLQLLTTGTS